MKISNQAILLTLVALGLGACSEDNPWGLDRGKGGIDLKLSASADVKEAIPVVRSGAPELVAPDAADFAISLSNMESGQTETWPTLADFNAEDGFDVGVYTLTAYYGNEHDCGFDKPYFKGETTVNVLEGRETQAEVTATLANSMLSIDYTEAFKSYFTDYSVTAHTAGESMVTFARTETRAAFMAPGDVVLELAMINPGGQSARLRAASFPAAATHHYHVTFDVDADPVGNAELVISFDDSLTQEDVTISLSDELFTSEAPKLVGEGFTDGVTVEALSGNISQTPLKFNAICKGGIKSATLTVAGEKNTPAFGREVELVGAADNLQSTLEANGVKVTGIFKNPAEMAIVDVTALSKFLPSDNYQITVRVTDMLDRVSEPVTLALSTKPVVLKGIDGSAIYSYPGRTQVTDLTVDATVRVSYNGINPQTNISFKNKCRFNGNGEDKFNDCEIVSVQESTRTRAFEEKTYIFNIKVCDAETSPLPIRIYFNGELKDEIAIDVIEPKFTIEADPFATYCKLRVNAEDPSQVATITNGLKIYLNGSKTPLSYTSEVIRDLEKGMITINNLTPSTDYNAEYCLIPIPDNGISQGTLQSISFTTEAATQIPNGDFSQTKQLKIDNIQVGGQYRTSAAGIYKNTSSIDRQVPLNWATINPKTCNPASSNINTWFVVPSTYVENGTAVIRNVGFSHNGVTPAQTGNLANTTYYNTNPASFSDDERVSGELFLGDYTFSGSEMRTDGIDFSSRPTSISFDYTYTPTLQDRGVAYIEVLDVSGTIIGSNRINLESQSSSKKVTLNLPAYEFGSKAATIRIGFKSSENTIAPILIPSGSALNDDAPKRGCTLEPNKYKAVATGSVLTIDNVTLNY